MSDRLDELQRQRALLQEHLAWLDREITRASGGARPSASAKAKADKPDALASPDAPTPVPASVPAPTPAPAPASVPVPVSVEPADADALIRQFATDPKDAQAGVKRGCWIVFLGAFAALGLVILTWWLLRTE